LVPDNLLGNLETEVYISQPPPLVEGVEDKVSCISEDNLLINISCRVKIIRLNADPANLEPSFSRA